MELNLNTIPYISLLILILIKYNYFTEIKNEFCNNTNLPIKLVLIFITIFLLSSIIEYNLGHYFILLLLLVQSIIIDGYIKDIKNKTNIYDKLYVFVMFLFGSFIITSSYLSKNYIISCLLIILGLGVFFGINYLVLVTSDTTTKIKLKNMTNNIVLGALVPILILSWCDYERKPLIKYVKLFYRK